MSTCAWVQLAVVGVVLAVCGWQAYEFRRLRRIIEGRFRASDPPVLRIGATVSGPLAYPGAVPPNRFVVVRWPGEVYHYQGCSGAAARTAYEHNHPDKGQAVEFWELGERRGRKAA